MTSMSIRLRLVFVRCWSLIMGRTFRFRYLLTCWLICFVCFGFLCWRSGEAVYLLMCIASGMALALTFAEWYTGAFK